MKVSSFVFGFVAVAFAAGASAQYKTGDRYQVVPIGGGVGVTRTLPAGSDSDVNATPGIPESVLHPVVPNANGPSGTFCGQAAVYTDNTGITERSPCQGHLVAYQAVSSQQVWQPAQAAYCSGGDSNETCYPATDGYFYTSTSSVFAADCPPSYNLTTTGSSGLYQYYSCIKS